jgi:hypothetical protein
MKNNIPFKTKSAKFLAFIKHAKLWLDCVTVYPTGLIGIDHDTLKDAVEESALHLDEDSIIEIIDGEQKTLVNLMEGEDWYFIDDKRYLLFNGIGKQDKNGKDIYEGHILLKAGNPETTKAEYLNQNFVVKWDEDHCKFFCDPINPMPDNSIFFPHIHNVKSLVTLQMNWSRVTNSLHSFIHLIKNQNSGTNNTTTTGEEAKRLCSSQ